MKFLIKLVTAILLLAILFAFDRFASMLGQDQPGRIEATINGKAR